ncbi:hypothetical protein D0A34_25010 [Microcoleus vaginatus PCC 9802]|nr:hypothetical protein D0A34_25010 [Microcoleus vaginatus PCC 9802]
MIYAALQVQKPPAHLEGTHDACSGCRAGSFLGVLKTCDRSCRMIFFDYPILALWATYKKSGDSQF